MLKKLLSFIVAFALVLCCGSVVASATTDVITDTEPNNDLETAQKIESNCTVTGTILPSDLEAEEPSMDLDLFAFTLTERSKITLTCSSDSLTLIPGITDETGDVSLMPELGEDMEELPDEYVIEDFLPKGTYYVLMFDIFNESEVTYTFTLKSESAVQTLKFENGVWRYYVGENFSEETTLMKYKGVWFYVENGIWNKTADTLVKYEDMWFYVKNGKWTSKPNTLIKYKGQWFYIKNGKWDKEAQTLVKYKGKWFYVKNGKWNKSTTIVNYKSKKFYVKGGFAQLDFSGKRKIGDQTFIIKNGKVV